MIRTSYQRCDEAAEISDEASDIKDEASNTDCEADVADDGDDGIGVESSVVGDEVSDYMDTLVRDHLRAVMERHQVPEDTPAQELDDAQRLFVIQLVPIGLRQDRDTLLAHLLRAALRVRSDAGGADSVAVDDFLRRTVNILKDVGDTEGTAFLQTVLEDLLRRDQADEDAPSTGRSSPVGRVSVITIFMENESFDVSFHDVVS